MSNVLSGVDQRTQLVGKNRLELLLFKLNGNQMYGINVFKVREVLPCPKLTPFPKAHPAVKGVAQVRGNAVSVVDLNYAIRKPPVEDLKKTFVIITEFNKSMQGFLVNAVDRIVNLNWEVIKPPPRAAGTSHYLTAVTRVDEEMVHVLDVEKILSEISPRSEEISDGVLNDDTAERARSLRVLACDDSSVARKQVRRVLERVGVEVVQFNDGRETLRHLKGLADQGINVAEHYLLLVSDIEMPEMDGYTLTAKIRSDERMHGLYIMLHTSLSGVFNEAMVEKVGANQFLPKFQPDELAAEIQARILDIGAELPTAPITD